MYLTDSHLGVVSFDLDSTLCDTSPRQHLVGESGGDKGWGTYSLACHLDLPGPALPIAQYLSSIGAPLAICSARDEIARSLTLEWLHDHGVNPWIVMLNQGDHNGLVHGPWKAQQLLKIEKILGRKIVAHFDDWSGVAEETEAVGIKTILVHEVNKLQELLV